ncbi:MULTISPECIES: hypothetical protein [unclassified Microcoleus]|uniref:hypothetical protein n=1 Tax=unclassified Microcoleus TaxID=2642155 RepID=UPI002FD58CD4
MYSLDMPYEIEFTTEFLADIKIIRPIARNLENHPLFKEYANKEQINADIAAAEAEE